jgi:hypothetical protein
MAREDLPRLRSDRADESRTLGASRPIEDAKAAQMNLGFIFPGANSLTPVIINAHLFDNQNIVRKANYLLCT